MYILHDIPYGVLHIQYDILYAAFDVLYDVQNGVGYILYDAVNMGLDQRYAILYDVLEYTI